MTFVCAKSLTVGRVPRAYDVILGDGKEKIALLREPAIDYTGQYFACRANA